MSVELEHVCSRCLTGFRQAQDLPVNVVYHPAAEVGAERHELHDDEMDMGFFRTEPLPKTNIGKILRRELRRAVPAKGTVAA